MGMQIGTGDVADRLRGLADKIGGKHPDMVFVAKEYTVADLQGELRGLAGALDRMSEAAREALRNAELHVERVKAFYQEMEKRNDETA